MIEKEAQEPWPLVVNSVICSDKAPPTVDTDSDEYAKLVFDMLVAQASRTALKELRKAGRLRNVQSLKLYCYNEDITKEKE